WWTDQPHFARRLRELLAMAELAANRRMNKLMQERSKYLDALSKPRRDENLRLAILTGRRSKALTNDHRAQSQATTRRPTTGDSYLHKRQTVLDHMLQKKGSRRLQPRFPILGECLLFHDNPPKN